MGIVRTKRVLLWAIVVLVIGGLFALASYLWDWSEVFIGGEAPSETSSWNLPERRGCPSSPWRFTGWFAPIAR